MFDTKLKWLIAPCLLLAACSSTPPITELPNTANPAEEISKVDANIKDAADRQVDVLAPKNFEKAQDTLDDAKEARNNNKSQEKILHKVAVAQGYLDKANQTAKVSAELLTGVIKERHDAIVADAPKYFPKEFSEADSDLKGISKDIEGGSTSGAEKVRAQLDARYNDLELQSIRKAKLGEAKTNFEQAIKEGAKKLTPDTLAWADKKLNEDDAVIMKDRHNTSAVDAASTDAKGAADRLLKMVRQAKTVSHQNPEQVAAQLEKDQVAAQKTEDKLDMTNSQLTSKEGEVAALSSENGKLTDKQRLEKQYEEARQEFTPEEAEVYKQGDKLLLRLKGLSFPKDQSVITTENYSLLTKVQKVIKDSNPNSVIIEGHTDSTGNKAKNAKLSTARAEAVASYLTANNSVKGAPIEAKGYGYTRPIASNKTAEGRAQNRRVDVIIVSGSGSNSAAQ